MDGDNSENDLVGAVSQHSKDSGLHPNNSKSSQNRKGILQIGKEFCKESRWDLRRF